MSVRLGEMLLKVGALDDSQLEQVLKAQAIYGGRLGTNLVEMGLVEEDQLARVLSDQLGVPCIENDELLAIPASLLELFPPELVARYRVLPIALDGKRLTVAMADPSDFKALDEIAFITGLVIIPRLCSELRLGIALERCYGIKRPIRYIPVVGGMRSRYAPSDGHPPALLDPAAAGWEEPGAEPSPRRLSIPDLAERLAAAAAEPEVVRALLDYLGGEFDRGGILRLKNGALTGVQAVAGWGTVPGFARYAAPLSEGSRLQRVVREQGFFLGEVGDGADAELLRAMGGEVPAPVLLVPVALAGQVAALICASDRRGRLGGGAFDLQRVAVMAELSFEILSSRKRLKSV